VTARAVVLGFVIICAAACGGGGIEHDYFTTEELMKPESCMECHPTYYREWSGSMHAYASDDPVFIAMNARGQADTGGALGDFCVRCHAPVARALGLTTDGMNLSTLEPWAKGVTCFFCHSVAEVQSDHNNPLVLANDGVLRGPIREPVDNPKHQMAYSALLDGNTPESSGMCGSCHDIVNGRGVHLERTFEEWKTTIFADERRPPIQQLSCNECHMFATTDLVADAPDLGVFPREFGRHEHTFAGIDVALTPWPETDAQLAAIKRDLDPAILPRQLCFGPDGIINFTLDNIGAGHKFPTGAAQDRRAWVEMIAYDESGGIVYQSGVVAPGEDPDGSDPELFRMWDDAFDENGDPTHFFWEVASHDDSTLLKPATTTCPTNPEYFHARTFQYPAIDFSQVARITARVFIRPLSYELMNELSIDPSIQALLPTHELEDAAMEWTVATAPGPSYCVMGPQLPPITPVCP
jgi:hypothetical protein